jgi:hypothetical protein
MPEPVTGASAACLTSNLSHAILVFGGYAGSRCSDQVHAITADAACGEGEVSVRAVDTSRSAPRGPCGRQDAAVVALGDRLVVFGGADVTSIGDFWELRNVQVPSSQAGSPGLPCKGKWKRLVLRGTPEARVGIPTPLSASCITKTDDGGFVVFGGELCDRGRSVEHSNACVRWLPWLPSDTT